MCTAHVDTHKSLPWETLKSETLLPCILCITGGVYVPNQRLLLQKQIEGSRLFKRETTKRIDSNTD
jgi:hypothetical protein